MGSRRLSENPHLPFDVPFDRLTVLSRVEGLTALSKAEGLRYPYPSSLRRTSMYASFLGISEALHLDIFHQPPKILFFDSFARRNNRWSVRPSPGDQTGHTGLFAPKLGQDGPVFDLKVFLI
jgi:hypothetical protein